MTSTIMPVDPVSGQVPEAVQAHSPNQDTRPAGIDPELVVIHGISLPPGVFGGDGVDRLFTNRLEPAAHPFYAQIQGLRVSAHLFLRRDGTLIQYVPLHRRAWHAGVSAWSGRAACNDFSVGIELEGCDDQPYSEAQYGVLLPLCRGLMAAYPVLSPARFVGHCDIAPERKTDPGPAFDWKRLWRGLEPVASVDTGKR